MVRINTEFVNSTEAPGSYRDDDLKGFILRVRETSSKGDRKPVKTYAVQGRIKGGKLILFTIGRHGAPWTAKLARDKARNVLNDMKNGIDPRVAEEKQRRDDLAFLIEQQVEAKSKTLTLRVVFEDWCRLQRKTKDRTKQLYREVIFKHLAAWLDKPMNEITESMITTRYTQVCTVTVSSANNAFRALRMLYNWARVEYKDASGKSPLPENPVSALSERGKWEKLHPRSEEYIHDDDLPAWFEAVLNLPNQSMSAYFRLLLLTGLRRDEAKKLKWSDVNFKRRHFTVRNTKNGRDLVLPITPALDDVFKDCMAIKRNDFVFPGDGSKGHITDVRHHYRLVSLRSGIRFTPHFARRTFSYAAARARLGDSERKRLLNHLDSGDVTEFAYTPWHIDQLREPSEIVQTFLLNRTTKKESVSLQAHSQLLM